MKRRLYPAELDKLIKDTARQALGPGQWVDSFSRPFVYFAPTVTAALRPKLVSAIETALTAVDGVEGAWDVRRALRWRDDPDPLKRSIGLSVATGSLGDIYVLPSRGTVVDEGRPHGAGSSHGTPWAYDTEVPVLFWGPGIEPNHFVDKVAQNRVAPTISALLGVPPPAGVVALPLPPLRPR